MKMTTSLRYALGISGTGILVALLIAYVERTILTINRDSQPFIALGEHLKNTATKAHLWFEEAMSGGESIDLETDVYGLFDASIEMLQNAMRGGQTSLGQFKPATDPEIMAIIEECMDDVYDLKMAATHRWELRQDQIASMDYDAGAASAGEEAGGALDQQFDAAYEDLLQTYESLTAKVRADVRHDNVMLNRLSWASISLVVLGSLGLGAVIYRIQFRNDALTEANQKRLMREQHLRENLATFIQKISNGDYNADLIDDDELSKQLVAMRDSLKANAEEENRRTWANTGMTQLGELLRKNYESISFLYDATLQFIVKYLKANQGGLYIINDDDENQTYLELVATYAFERKKFITARIDKGEGLVGQCYQEARTIYLLEVPENYIKITSGLGQANPSAVLLIPLMMNQDVFGVLEMANFKKFEPHEIQLLERFGRSIASTISAVKISDRTKNLLEQTQQQAEEMRSQEEEMRQNMEELSATQEEMARKEKEYIARIDQLERELHSHPTA